MMAEVKWFYRVSELHEPLYLMLMEDRKHSEYYTFGSASDTCLQTRGCEVVPCLFTTVLI